MHSRGAWGLGDGEGLTELLGLTLGEGMLLGLTLGEGVPLGLTLGEGVLAAALLLGDELAR
jgi:hypothetical protein